jgi:hypothetical protein
VLQLIVQRIVVEDHRITIEHVVPSGPIRLQPEHHLNPKIRFHSGRALVHKYIQPIEFVRLVVLHRKT